MHENSGERMDNAILTFFSVFSSLCLCASVVNL
jgi:hypothetical protein